VEIGGILCPFGLFQRPPSLAVRRSESPLERPKSAVRELPSLRRRAQQVEVSIDALPAAATFNRRHRLALALGQLTSETGEGVLGEQPRLSSPQLGQRGEPGFGVAQGREDAIDSTKTLPTLGDGMAVVCFDRVDDGANLFDALAGLVDGPIVRRRGHGGVQGTRQRATQRTTHRRPQSPRMRAVARTDLAGRDRRCRA
jgi:hypothetical protein